jgi:signal transduction histidine kinase
MGAVEPADKGRLRVGPRSLRGRLALLFALGSALLLLASAGSLYVILNRQLQAAIDQGLRARVTDIAADVGSGTVVVRPEELFAQVVSTDNRVLAASEGIAASAPVLTSSEVRRAARHEIRIDRGVRGLGDDARLLARPVETSAGPVIVVVGTSRTTMLASQRKLAIVLAVFAPLLIGAVTVAGWLLAGAALHPVGRMTEEADAISLAEAGRRLPQPAGDDEIARLGRTLNAMLDRMEASFARERAFVDDASHELRTPLAILRGELELALLQTDDSAETERALRSALEEAERLSRLADDLLVLARSQAGDIPLTLRDTDVLAAVSRVAERVAGSSGTGGPTVRVAGRPVHAAVDPGRLDQIMLNLLGNAQRFAASSVQVSLRQLDDELEITVADDGPGFSARLLPHAFDRFTRGDQARNRGEGGEGGAGLGLAIVAALVTAHGGSVEAMNGPPLGGAVVRVRLPARRAGAPAQAPAGAPG